MYVDRGHAAAGVRVVDHVVVHQCAGVQQFEGCKQSQRPIAHRILGLGGHRAVSPVGERGPEALAAPQYEVLEDGDHPVIVLADIGRLRAPLGQVDAQLLSDGARQFGGRRRGCFEAQRTPLSAAVRWVSPD